MAVPSLHQHADRRFGYLLAISLLLHVGLFWCLVHAPGKKQSVESRSVMVDLNVLPSLDSSPSQHQQKSLATRPLQPLRQITPKADAARRQDPAIPKKGRLLTPEASVKSPPTALRPPSAPAQGKATEAAPAAVEKPSASRQGEERAPSAGESLFKPRGKRSPVPAPQLFPRSDKLAMLEEKYRQNRAAEKDNSTDLDPDDSRLASLLHRYDDLLTSAWRIPTIERSVEVAVVRITFNSRGETEQVVLLESSGDKKMDQHLLRTLQRIGPIGSLPKGYPAGPFTLIKFVHFSQAGSIVRFDLY